MRSLPIAELRRRAQGTAPLAGREPLLGRTFRFFSVYLTWIFIRLPITPNQITAVSVLFFFLGIGLFAWNNLTPQLVGCAIIYFSTVLDASDGEVARLKYPKNIAGGIYAEPVSHDFQYAFMYFPLTLGAYSATGTLVTVLFGAVAVVAKLLFRLIGARETQLSMWMKIESSAGAVSAKDFQVAFNPDVGRFHKFYRFINRTFMGSGNHVILLTIFALLRRLDLFLLLFAVYNSAVLAVTFVNQLRRLPKPKAEGAL
ncbi:CDP-alcohol phosphatidyltransferase family protein [Patescibacteria group bacterium]|nr:MAG: CDP-alcohol phosphatidyltransferase family protein [Patescibacteria group bacterium]